MCLTITDQKNVGLQVLRRDLSTAKTLSERYRLGNEVFKCAVSLRANKALSDQEMRELIVEIDNATNQQRFRPHPHPQFAPDELLHERAF